MGLKKYQKSDNCRKYKKKTCHVCNGGGKTGGHATPYKKCEYCNGEGKILVNEHNYGKSYYDKNGSLCSKCTDCGYLDKFWEGN